MKHTLIVGALAACGLLSAPAQVIFQETYDTSSTPNGFNALAWSGGTIANTSVTYVDGVGGGGTRGVLFANDFLAPWNGYVAYQCQNGYITGNTSPNLTDYTLSFDLNVVGPIPLNALQLNVKGASGNWWGGTWTETTAGAVPVNAVTGWQHVSVNLGNSSIWASNLLIPTFGTIQLQFQVNGWQLAGGGPAIGEQVVLDNVMLTMVPEPSCILLTGLGLSWWLLARRRN
jgi:hypothetical protein